MKNRHIKTILVIVLVVLVTAAAAAVIVLDRTGDEPLFPGIGQTSNQTDSPTDGTHEATSAQSQPSLTEPVVQTQPKPVGLEYPIILEGGKLEIESMFSYSGLNPDDDNAEVKDIAAITLVNRSGEYLAEARITLVLSNGTEADFVATDLPNGKCVMAYSVDSIEIDNDTVCTDVRCEAAFDAAASMEADRIAVSADAMTVTLRNLTGSEISNIVIYCRCPLGEDYFGGVTYQYQVNSLPANGTATVEAWDCVLGMAEVVRIEINE